MNDFVTVIIPTRGRLPRLRRTVASALAQGDVDLELVVVDDGSVDGTSDYLRQLAGDDRRLRPVRHRTARGVAAARNSGIAIATGNWISFLDDDDLWSPDKLRSQLDMLRSAGAAWAYSAVVIVDSHLRPLSIDPSPEPKTVFRELLARQAVPAGSSNVIVKAELLKSVGGFDESLAHFADWDLWIRLAQAAQPARCEAPLVAYVQHGEAMHLEPSVGESVSELAYIDTKHAQARHELSQTLDVQTVARWIASGHRQAGRRGHEMLWHLRAAFRYGDAKAILRAFRAPLRRRTSEELSSVPARDVPPWLTALRRRG